MTKKQDFRTTQVLEYLAIVGEATTDDIADFFNTPAYIKKLITNAKKDKVLKERRKDKKIFLSLSAKGKKELLIRYTGKYGLFFSGSNDLNKLHNDISRTDRRKKLIHLLKILGQSNVKVLPSEKQLLFIDSSRSAADGADGSRLEFYTSQELKILFPEYKCARGSRALGILINKSSFYVIYYADDSKIIWKEETERSFAVRTENYIARFVSGTPNPVSAILFSNNVETAVGFMKRMNNESDNSICRSKDISRLIFAKISEEDETLRLITDNENIPKTLKAIFSGGGEVVIKSLDADGESRDGPYICAFDSDIKRIGRFIVNCALNNRNGIVICFDYQTEYIELFIEACREDFKRYNTDFCIRVVSKSIEEYRRQYIEEQKDY